MKFLFALALVVSLTAAQANAVEWTERELRVLQSFNLKNLGPAPTQPSNAYADNRDAAALGKKLFFDKRLSANGKLSCASCHIPEQHFTDGRPRAIGINATGRNTMSIVGSAHQRWFYWDGRRDSLWSQALIPFEAPDEMGSSRTEVLRVVMSDSQLSQHFTRVFGKFPKSLSLGELTEHAGPYANKSGKDNWNRLNPRRQREINGIYANLGKAIAAFERTINYSPTRFDRYLDDLKAGKTDSDLLSSEEKSGAKLFIDAKKTQCLQCHNGPTLSNGDFHNIGTGNFSGEHLDFGRVFGLQAVLMDEFNCLGPFSDADKEQCTELRFLKRHSHVPLEGSFKTPSLRNVSETAPYFHDGSRETLESVLRHYNAPPNKQQTGAHELRNLELSDEEIKQLESFLKTLTD